MSSYATVANGTGEVLATTVSAPTPPGAPITRKRGNKYSSIKMQNDRAKVKKSFAF